MRRIAVGTYGARTGMEGLLVRSLVRILVGALITFLLNKICNGGNVANLREAAITVSIEPAKLRTSKEPLKTAKCQPQRGSGDLGGKLTILKPTSHKIRRESGDKIRVKPRFAWLVKRGNEILTVVMIGLSLYGFCL